MRVLGIDLGSVRIGLAVSDPDGRIAFPAGVLDRKGQGQDVAELVVLIRERSIERVVVGLPLHMDGRAGTGAEAARRFASALAEASGLPVDTLDERWSSLEAERSLRETGALRREETRRRRKKKRGKGAIDEVAASIILRTYLERRRSGAGGANS
jgi:putative Holliday junction resolvase